jgi:hypothetical protein
MPLSELRPLFQSFVVGLAMVARGNSVGQLLDAAVRSVSAFGSADEMVTQEAMQVVPRHTVRTAEFLRGLRAAFVGVDRALDKNFDVPLKLVSGVEDITIDYADGPLLVQITSLASTKRQAESTKQEVQSKVFELDLVRREMIENALQPVLMVNTDALETAQSADAKSWAQRSRERLQRVADVSRLSLVEARDGTAGARLLRELRQHRVVPLLQQIDA